MSNKRLSEKELLDGITPLIAHADEVGTGTLEDDELKKLVTWVETYAEDYFSF